MKYWKKEAIEKIRKAKKKAEELKIAQEACKKHCHVINFNYHCQRCSIIKELKREMKAKIYPVNNFKTHHCWYFKETCSQCGCFHWYRKYAGWQKRNHIPMCDSVYWESQKQLDLF